jgi:hypothetical protein
MTKNDKTLLLIDGAINIALGIVLLLFPLGTARLLGIPVSDSDFYPTILGAVLFGIGIALLIERFGVSKNVRGLGLGGAIAINFCGGVALVVWLVFGPLAIPLKGSILLWTIAVLVIGLALIETFSKSWRFR